jgi:RNA polymerase sigma-70 factor (ECF subfamily)
VTSSVSTAAGAGYGATDPTPASSGREGHPSLAELYDTYADFVYRSLVSLGVPVAVAEDAMQDVFLVAHAKLDEFRGPFFKAWLFRLAFSIARNVRRSVRRADHTSAELDPDSLPDASRTSPFDDAAQAERIRLLHSLLEQLDEDKRNVFILAELEQMPQVEIAAALDIHVNTVAYRLNIARERLQQLLHRHNAREGERKS